LNGQRAQELLAAAGALDRPDGSLAERLGQLSVLLTEALEVERCWLVRLDGDVLRTMAGVGMVLAAPQHPPLPLSKGVVGRCAREARSSRVDDVLKNADYYAATALTRSELAVPMLVDGRVVGVINVEANRLGAFGDAEQALVERVAALLGPRLCD
jgi:putative methionine-R-sulfoxide reductase with GAF domain